MATRKKAQRKPTPAARAAVRRTTPKAGKRPAKKAPVRRASPPKATAALRPPAKQAAASPPQRPAAPQPAPASAPVPPFARWPMPASALGPPAPAGERIGVVTHYYSHLSVAVVRVESGPLRVGDMILIRGHTSDFTQRVESLQVEHAPVTNVGPSDAVALKVTGHAREHDVVYRLGP